MFKWGDRVLIKSENEKATVIGYSVEFKDLVLLVPDNVEYKTFNFSAFEDELEALDEI